ncbi:MAG: hypothetical protein JNN20_00835 [Betaproteobacteria bacterium]|nr:hypothetical protein [Betaproteobacteria bacterium]
MHRNLPSTNELASLLRKLPKVGTANALTSSESTRLTGFANSEVAKLAQDGIVALYMALDGADQSDTLDRLRKPLGAFAMAIQISAGAQPSRTSASALASTEKSAIFADACKDMGCRMRGRSFLIHESGMFDVIGGKKPAKRNITLQPPSKSLIEQLGSQPTDARVVLRYGNGGVQSRSTASYEECASRSVTECFGVCGIGCPPAQITRDACYGHDFCDCMYGAAACLMTVPEGCVTDKPGVPCASMTEAVADLLVSLVAEAVLSAIAVVESLFEYLGGVVVGVIEGLATAIEALFDAISEFLDWLFEENCEEEESSEAC